MSKKPNAFMIFVEEWRSSQNRSWSIAEATKAAGVLWEKMGDNERAKYRNMAKDMKVAGKKPTKLACNGVPVDQVNRQMREEEQTQVIIKQTIEKIVRDSVDNYEFEKKSYFFLTVNYFCKVMNSHFYSPAEISVSEYSLAEGVKRVYHALLNPESANSLGYLFDAKQHASNSHMLPLPPNALGTTNVGSVYNDVLKFIQCKETGMHSPVYTTCDSMPIVKAVLDFMRAQMEAQLVEIVIYPIQHLFYVMKKAACDIGGIEKPKSHFLTDNFFNHDYFEHVPNLSCDYHDKLDRSKYCTKSCVQRWGYLFSDYMCHDLAIKLIFGRHVPAKSKTTIVVTDPVSNYPIFDSPKKEEKPFKTTSHHELTDRQGQHDDESSPPIYKPSMTTSNIKFANDDFPMLNSKSRGKGKSMRGQRNATPSKIPIKSEDDDELNPWSEVADDIDSQPDIRTWKNSGGRK